MSVTSVETQAGQRDGGWVTASAPDSCDAEDTFRIEDVEAEPESSNIGPKLLAGLLIVLALGWIGRASCRERVSVVV